MAFDVLRSLVAGKRRRFRDETFSLDLAYITPRVIAMSLPGEGAASSYRNPIDEVVRFLYMRHGTHFRIFNLAERTYDYSRFPAGAVVEAGFPDLNTCPLHVAINLARQMHEFLALAPRNVVAVHCLAGKGRTGVVIGAYLLLTLAVRDELWSREGLEAGLARPVPLPLQSEAELADEEEAATKAVIDAVKRGPQPAPTPAEIALVESAVPPAFEMAARACLTFKRRRGDGLNYNAQRRTLRYIAEGVRAAVIESMLTSGEGRRIMDEQAAFATAVAATAPVVGETGAAGEAVPASEVLAAPPAAALDKEDNPFESAAVAVPVAPCLPPPQLRTFLALPAVANLAAPAAPTIVIWNVVLHGIPRRAGSAEDSGCAPSVQLRSLPHQHLPDTSLFDSAWSSAPGTLRRYTQDDDAIVININAVLGGDVLLRVMHHPGQDVVDEVTGAVAPKSKAARASALMSSAFAGLSGLGQGLLASAQKLQTGVRAALSPRSAAAASSSSGAGAAATDTAAAAQEESSSSAEAAAPAAGAEGAAPDADAAVVSGAPAVADAAAAAAATPATPAPAAADAPAGGGEPTEGSEEDADIDSESSDDEEGNDRGTAPPTAPDDDDGAYNGPDAGPVTAVGGPLVPRRAGAGRPREVLRYAFNTAFMTLDQREGPTIHRVFLADVDQERRHKARGGGPTWRLPEGFYLDITYGVKGAAGGASDAATEASSAPVSVAAAAAPSAAPDAAAPSAVSASDPPPLPAAAATPAVPESTASAMPAAAASEEEY